MNRTFVATGYPPALILMAALAACSGDSSGNDGRGGAGAAGGGGGPGAAGAGDFANSDAGGTGTGGMNATPNAGAGGDSSAGSGGGRMVTENCAATEAEAMDTTTAQPADIIIAVDTSGSMSEEIGFVQDNLNAFAQSIVASGIDVRVILIAEAADAANAWSAGVCIAAPLGSGTCPADTNLPQYVHINQPVGSNDGLNVIIDTYGQWSQYLRPGATKSFVIITDDDATDAPNNSASAFAQSVAALDPTLFQEWSFSGIYCFSNCPDAAAIGSVYVDLVSQTGGVSGDLCLQDFEPVFNRLSEQIITGSGSAIACEWPFPEPPMGQTFATDLVEVRRTSAAGATTTLARQNAQADCGAQGGWSFDDPQSPTKIVACPSTCTELQGDVGGKINVVFGCALIQGCAASGSAATSMRQGADIIVAIDSSQSMDAEIAFVQDNMNAFSQQIVASGVDVRVILIADQQAVCIGAPLGSGQCPNDSNAPNYFHIDQPVGSNDVLNIYLDSYAQWSQHLRPGARKMFVVITDDDATDGPINSAAAFSSGVPQLDSALFSDWAYSGIFCFTECPDAAAIGAVHAELVQMTGGVSGDLCLQDFAPVFDELAQAIITGSELACEWEIPEPPMGETLDFGSVNVQYVNSAGVATLLGNVPSEAECASVPRGWHYDDPNSPTRILACAETCAEMRTSGASRVDVLFGCETCGGLDEDCGGEPPPPPPDVE